MNPYGDHSPDVFHIGQHDDPPELSNLKNFIRKQPVTVTRSTNLPARAINVANSFAHNPVPTVNTINPGSKYLRP